MELTDTLPEHQLPDRSFIGMYAVILVPETSLIKDLFKKLKFPCIWYEVIRVRAKICLDVAYTVKCSECNIKVIPCVEGDGSDCQPEANSSAGSRRLEHEVVAFAVRYKNSLVYKQMTIFSLLLLVSAQVVHIPLFFRMSLQQNTDKF